MHLFQVLSRAMFCLLVSLGPSSSMAEDYKARQSLFSVKVPAGWTVVERYASDDRMQQKNSLVDFVGDNYPYPGPRAANFTRQPLAVAITVRSTDSEGDSLNDYVQDYLEIAGGPPGPSFKPYGYAFLWSGAKRYYSVDRLVKPVSRAPDMRVGGERGVAFTFAATISSTSLDDPTEHNGKLKQVLVKHGSDIIALTLSSFDVVFSRDEVIFDDFLRSIRWGNAVR